MKRQSLSGVVASAIVCAALLAALSVSGLAQITTTGIRGIVRDPIGAVVPNATVKVTDNSTGVEQTTMSSSDGDFIFSNLPFGSYKLTAEYGNRIINTPLVGPYIPNVAIGMRNNPSYQGHRAARADKRLALAGCRFLTRAVPYQGKINPEVVQVAETVRGVRAT